MIVKHVTRAAYGAGWVVVASFLVSCSAAPVDPRGDEQTLRSLDTEWVKAAQAKSVDQWVAFYTDDAAVLPANEPMATDKASIRKSISGLLGLPGVDLSWRPTRVEVAHGGDLAYVYGTYQLTFESSPGKPRIGERLSRSGRSRTAAAGSAS